MQWYTSDVETSARIPTAYQYPRCKFFLIEHTILFLTYVDKNAVQF